MQKIGVIGAGAWGTALAAAAVNAGRDTLIWAREPEVVTSINTLHTNSVFLPDVALDPLLKATGDMADMKNCDAILLVNPAQYTRPIVTELTECTQKGVPFIICSKGIEISTGKLLSEVIEEVAPHNPACVLSGPTFAIEVAKGLPCALTLATKDKDLGGKLINALGHPAFRPYYNDDVIGAQIGGAVKNVMAIATGIVAGLGIGENARAAVITRGLAEIARFGEIYGAKTETLMGLSGLGDLILTCSSTQSRNMSLGKAIGEGQTFASIMAERNSVAEGAHTVEIVYKIAEEKGLEMPITSAVYHILKKEKNVKDVMEKLMNRPFKIEGA